MHLFWYLAVLVIVILHRCCKYVQLSIASLTCQLTYCFMYHRISFSRLLSHIPLELVEVRHICKGFFCLFVFVCLFVCLFAIGTQPLNYEKKQRVTSNIGIWGKVMWNTLIGRISLNRIDIMAGAQNLVRFMELVRP